MARVHDHDHTNKCVPGQIRAGEVLPLLAQRLRRARITVPGQVDEARLLFILLAEPVEVDGLRAAWSFAREGEALAAEERVDRARLADVRAPGEGDLWWPGGRQIAGPADRGDKLCLREYSNKIAPFDDRGARR